MRTESLRSRGMSIIELMVGLVVALLVGLAATGSAIFFTASQRQAAGTSTASSNAHMIMAVVKEEVAQAGLGFFNGAFLCSSLNLSVGTTDLSQASFSPLQVTRDAHGNDTIDVVYGSAIASATNVFLAAESDLNAAQLKGYLPAAVGQAVLLAPRDTGLCTVRSITAVDAATKTLTFDSTGTHNQLSPVAYPATYGVNNGAVGLLGALQWSRYRVDNGNLLFERPLINSSVVLIRDVAAFRVRYGVANGTETAISSWVTPTTAWAALNSTNIGRVKAVQIGLLLRSPQRIREENCVSETRQLLEEAVTVSRCYRYRDAVITVPVRNIVWGTPG